MPDPYRNAENRSHVGPTHAEDCRAQQSDQGCTTQAARPMTTTETIDYLLSYHAPRPDQLPKYEAIRTAARYFAEIIVKNTPGGADQSASIRKLRECVMTANAAIAIDGVSL